MSIRDRAYKKATIAYENNIRHLEAELVKEFLVAEQALEEKKQIRNQTEGLVCQLVKDLECLKERYKTLTMTDKDLHTLGIPKEQEKREVQFIRKLKKEEEGNPGSIRHLAGIPTQEGWETVYMPFGMDGGREGRGYYYLREKYKKSDD